LLKGGRPGKGSKPNVAVRERKKKTLVDPFLEKKACGLTGAEKEEKQRGGADKEAGRFFIGSQSKR